MGIKPISVRSLNDDYFTSARPAISSSATDVCHILTNMADDECLPMYHAPGRQLIFKNMLN